MNWYQSQIEPTGHYGRFCHFLSKNSNNLTYKHCQKLIKSMKNTSNIHRLIRSAGPEDHKGQSSVWVGVHHKNFFK